MKEAIPDNFIVKCDFESLTKIAQKQILSLYRRRQLTGNSTLYTREINRVIQFELSRAHSKKEYPSILPSNLKNHNLKAMV